MEDVFGSYEKEHVYEKYMSAMSASAVLNMEVEHLNVNIAKKEVELKELSS